MELSEALEVIDYCGPSEFSKLDGYTKNKIRNNVLTLNKDLIMELANLIVLTARTIKSNVDTLKLLQAANTAIESGDKKDNKEFLNIVVNLYITLNCEFKIKCDAENNDKISIPLILAVRSAFDRIELLYRRICFLFDL